MKYFDSRICSQSMRLLRQHFWGVFKLGWQILLTAQVSRILVPETGAWVFFVARITFSMVFLVALNTNACVVVVLLLNTISIAFLVTLITHIMELFVALKTEF